MDRFHSILAEIRKKCNTFECVKTFQCPINTDVTLVTPFFGESILFKQAPLKTEKFIFPSHGELHF